MGSMMDERQQADMIRDQRRNYAVFAIWAVLVGEALFALVTQRWSTLFVAVATLVLSMLPAIFASRFDIRLPVSFFAAAVIFIFATIFLGEAGNFYEKYWWWDVVLHAGSAVGFGLLGFLFIFMLFEGDRYAAPAWAIGFMAFSLAVSIGAIWEIFEFAMDQTFGLNMQKNGLQDTMWDLIVDCLGAGFGATMGFLYLKGRELGGLGSSLDEFVRLNRRLFKKARLRRGRNREE
ncbi:hypothetical protein [Litorisediminicola beolgyonensis]|uniref:Inner membrane protein YjdF n=1 Tax=Litorisediminicola beolgyonensis TaxID=1173614 RepID=A0ABW3ZDF3_9RHOB